MIILTIAQLRIYSILNVNIVLFILEQKQKQKKNLPKLAPFSNQFKLRHTSPHKNIIF